jgi:predicted pyridoxine 5'-phosphate oxidase superfamily flavin-nucleotide-binding protein
MLSDYRELIESYPAHIATVSDRNEPNLAVASDAAVVSDNQLLISHNEMIKTVENIIANGNVCLTVFDKNWQGVRIYGTAEYFSDGEWLEKVKDLFTNENTQPKGAILVTVDKIENQS